MISPTTTNIVSKVGAKVGPRIAADQSEAERAEARKRERAKEAAKKAVQSGGDVGPIADAAKAVLQVVGQGFAKALEVEKLVSTPFAMIPCPGQPAVRAWDAEVGLPHGHMHPPNLVPPAPMIFLPSLGFVLPIPWLSTADSVKINGSNAGRCGDMAVSIWCGGYFPLTEIFTGSASVWLEGGRAARAGDVTNHCIFTVPKPTDLPCGPFIGGVASGSGNVVVGGFPMPSLTAAALAAAMKIAGKAMKAGAKGAASLFRKGVNELEAAAARRAVVPRILERAGLENVSADFVAALRNRLDDYAAHKAGRDALERAANGKHAVRFAPVEASRHGNIGPHVDSVGPDGYVRRVYEENGAFVHESGGPMFNLGEHGPGTSPIVHFDPSAPNGDRVLAHELSHASNFVEGKSMVGVTSPDPEWAGKWKNYDEYQAVAAENAHAAATGQPLRDSYIPFENRKTLYGEPSPAVFDDDIQEGAMRDTDPSPDPFGDTLPPTE